MAFGPFGRNRNQDIPIVTNTIPEEVREYYEATKHQRTGIAWLLAFTTLVVTVLLAMGLFFGGRMAYRKLTHKPAQIAATEQASPSKPAQTSPSTSQHKPAEAPATNPSDSTPHSSTTLTAPAPTSSHRTAAPTQVPNTGPGNVLAIFVASTLVGSIAYRTILLRRLK